MQAMKPPVIFTENAAKKVWALIEEENNFNLKLRVFITGGGCSGFQYGFTFEENQNTEDCVITKFAGTHQVDLLIDPISLQYLMHAEVDYEENIKGAQFIIRNPNAKTTCGCGSSFTVEEKEEEKEEKGEEEK